MPFRTIRLQPGVNTQASQSLNQTQLSASNLIRFYTGLVQKLGGWAAMSLNTIIGICRGMHGWSDLNGNPYTACGTEQRLQVLIRGAIYDITPILQTDNPAVAFSTTATSTLVTITDSSYTPNVGDWIYLNTYVSVGGIVLQGFYQVVTLPTGTTYTVNAASPATGNVSGGGAVSQFTTTNGQPTVQVTLANHGFITGVNSVNFIPPTTVGGITVTGGYAVGTVIDANNFDITVSGTASSGTSAFQNGGDAQILYLLPTGYAVNTPIAGFGIGLYGEGEYGLTSAETITAKLRQWSLDHWGQSLIANPSNLGIYYWTPPTVSPAVIVGSQAPLYNTAVFVMPQIRIIVALGAESSGTQYPLLIRWCDQDDFTDWNATATNQAGSFTLSSGTILVGGIPTGLGSLIWTDTDVWFMQYLGYPLVFGFTQLAGSCGLISLRAAGDCAGIVAWLSTRGFYTYQAGGGVDSIECPVWDFIFENLDNTQLDQVHCAVNALFNEMAWHFPVAPTSPIYNAATPLAYVKWNFVENAWDYGMSAQYQRTAWVEKNPASNPAGTDYNGLIQQHEVSNDADGAGMVWSWQTGYVPIGEGEDMSFVDWLIPDFVVQSDNAPPQIKATVLATNFPVALSQAAPIQDGPYTIDYAQPGGQAITCRIRAREIALQCSGSDVGTFNRIGAIRVRYKPDGRG